MEHRSKVLILFAVFLLLSPHEAVGNVYFDCFESAVCKEKGGIQKMLACDAYFTKKESGLYLGLFKNFYPEQVSNFLELIHAECKYPDEAKEASDFYLEEREKNQKNLTREDNAGFSKENQCVIKLIDECITNKQLGIL